jgi:restriction endonuclease-like protein
VHEEPGGRARDIARERLLAAGMEITDNYVACGVSVDLLVRDPSDAKRVAVFVDAERAEHRPVDLPERVDQHSMLERAGWTVCRLPATTVLSDPDKVVDLVRTELHHAPTGRKTARPEEIIDYVLVDTQDGIGFDDPVPALGITPEDRVDYHWDVPSVSQRLDAGEPVFRSQFEIDLYDALANRDGIKVTPQWPARAEIIALVVTAG